MFCSFQRVFNPTEEQKKEMADQMKRIRAQLVRERHCAVCKNSSADLVQLPNGVYDYTEKCCLGNKREMDLYQTCDLWEENDAN